jgi:hypothetical protein
LTLFDYPLWLKRRVGLARKLIEIFVLQVILMLINSTVSLKELHFHQGI